MELAVAGAPGSDLKLLDAVRAALQGLHLQPVQLVRLHEAFVLAVARRAGGGKPPPTYQLHIRVWLLGPCTPERGWGFFLVEKGEDACSVAPHTNHLVELFLYQECDL